MAGCKVWDVVAVPFPYTKGIVQQRRPGLVIRAIADQGSPRLLWVMMITSASNRAWAGDIEVEASAGTGLPVASLIRTAKVATVEAGDASTIGTLPAAEQSAVMTELWRVLPREAGP